MNPNFPYQFDGRGRTLEPTPQNHLEQMIEQVLFTSPGERVNMPDFGSGLLQLAFTPNSVEMAAATQFAVLNAALLIPPTYMQELDGIGYGWGGLAGNLIMDASLSLAACGTLALVMWLLRQRALRSPELATIAEAIGVAPAEQQA